MCVGVSVCAYVLCVSHYSALWTIVTYCCSDYWQVLTEMNFPKRRLAWFRVHAM